MIPNERRVYVEDVGRQCSTRCTTLYQYDHLTHLGNTYCHHHHYYYYDDYYFIFSLFQVSVVSCRHAPAAVLRESARTPACA